MTVDPLQYARRWKTLAVLSLSLVIIGLDNTILNVALPTLQDEFDASAFEAAVDGRLLSARVRGPAARLRHARRPLRAQARAPGGRDDLRARQPRGPHRRLRQRGDRRARGDGRGRGADHARHPLDHRQPVHRRRNAGRRSRSGPRWPRLASGSDRWPAGCCSSGSAGRPSSSSTCRSPLPRCCSASATCPKAGIHGPGGSTYSERRSPRPASASSSTRSSRRPSRVG